MICGEPGIGKTAVVEHLVRHRGPMTRALVGVCDELSDPSALGAFQDVGERLGVVARLPDSGSVTSAEYARLLLEHLSDGEPTVLVAEDLQWANRTALDVLKVLGRRVGGLPVLMVLTYRPGEAGDGHPLWPTLDGLQASTGLHLQPQRLSRGAVHRLATRAGRTALEAQRVYRLSRGNPWLAGELASSPDEAPTPSVSSAVLGWTARLGESTRLLAELLCVVPEGLTEPELDILYPAWARAAAAAEKAGLVAAGSSRVGFRYEAVRLAVLSRVPQIRRRELSGQVSRARDELGPPAVDGHDDPAPGPPGSSTGAAMADLTGRQLEVLRLLAAGHTNGAIAERLTISPRTVEHHVSDLLRRLGATTRTEVAARCLRQGIPSASQHAPAG